MSSTAVRLEGCVILTVLFIIRLGFDTITGTQIDDRFPPPLSLSLFHTIPLPIPSPHPHPHHFRTLVTLSRPSRVRMSVTTDLSDRGAFVV